MHIKYFLLFLPLILLIFVLFSTKKHKSRNEFRYVALGDSYTIGLGVNENQRWPNLVVKNYNKIRMKKINLIANLAVSGHTTEDVIQYQIPLLSSYKPDVVTLLIGANDSFSYTDVEKFKKNYESIITQVLQLLFDKKNLILISLPDHSKSPSFKNIQEAKIESKLINRYNEIIREMSLKYKLPLADIYPISQKNISNEYFISDGLHPSPLGYTEWSKIVLQTLIQIIKE